MSKKIIPMELAICKYLLEINGSIAKAVDGLMPDQIGIKYKASDRARQLLKTLLYFQVNYPRRRYVERPCVNEEELSRNVQAMCIK